MVARLSKYVSGPLLKTVDASPHLAYLWSAGALHVPRRILSLAWAVRAAVVDLNSGSRT